MLAGRLDDDATARAVGRARAFVFAACEDFGIAPLEAQAAGTPVIAAAVGGLTTVVTDQDSGLLLDSHEPVVWASALRRVLLDDAFRARLAQGARRRGQAFSWEATAERTLDVYERARHALRELV